MVMVVVGHGGESRGNETRDGEPALAVGAFGGACWLPVMPFRGDDLLEIRLPLAQRMASKH